MKLRTALFSLAILGAIFAQPLRSQTPAPAAKAGDLPRVFLIGDSISLGYTAEVKKRLQGKAEVTRPPVNCQHTGYGLANLKTWLGEGKWDVIHFNWGIWDTHLLDARGNLVRTADEAKAAGAGALRIRYTRDQYRENLEKLAAVLQGTGARLIWASTTPILSRTGPRFDEIRLYNETAAGVMKARGITIDDLYSAALPKAAEWQSGDRVHFNPTGNEALGALVAAAIERALKP